MSFYVGHPQPSANVKPKYMKIEKRRASERAGGEGQGGHSPAPMPYGRSANNTSK